MTKPTGTSESPSIKTALIKSEEMAHQTEEGATSNSRKVKKTKGRVSHKRNGSNNTIRNNDKKIRERSISEYKLDGKYFSDSDSGYDSSHSGGIPSSGSISSSDSDNLISNHVGGKSESESGIGVAGHSDTFVKINEEYIGKLTTASEAEVYTRREELGLDLIIPTSKTYKDLNQNEMDALSPLISRAQKDKQMEVIIPERLGRDIPDAQKLEMDVKIGFKTASLAQLKAVHHKYSLKKVAKHKAIDSAYGSASRGYRVEGLKIKGKKSEANRLSLTRNSKKHIKDVVRMAGTENKRKILIDLKAIRGAFELSPVTFVASSTLFMIDEKNPENTKVKLIDLAHPIYEGYDDFHSKKKENIAALNMLIAYVDNVEKVR